MTSEATDSPLQTPLYDLHVERGGRMVPFAGYALPVQYPLGIVKEHLHTRAAAGLFDVSHMGQVRLTGSGVAEALEGLVPVDVVGLGEGRQRYACFTNEAGGILDDLMISNLGDCLFLVVNAACKEQDIAHLKAGLGSGVALEELTDRALLALQGPAAAGVLAGLAPEVATQPFMSVRRVTLQGADCLVARSGYTGEDGYEISVPNAAADALARKLLSHDDVEAIGLGARDSLRLEAGLCLYGNDIDTETTPVEASIAWSISKARRAGGAREGGFPGAATILGQLAEGASRRRVGLKPSGRAPVREGATLHDESGAEVGRVTSGGFGPSFEGPVAMGYVEKRLAEPGTALSAMVRGKPLPIEVARLPFVEQRYYRG